LSFKKISKVDFVRVDFNSDHKIILIVNIGAQIELKMLDQDGFDYLKEKLQQLECSK